ncbi:unnamed protein product [Leptidea sinapis]|uniref:GST C-terminal domain-containing protein n=1 Tax=Leptidea sinapis TaxID=189913 RepID=A0A5E4QJ83_9NEOP|nr:unnamed protein product [Leptidea sinapis]
MSHYSYKTADAKRASYELCEGEQYLFESVFGSEQIVQTIQVLEDELITRGTNYFGGSRPGMVDYMIWPWVERLYLIRAISPGKRTGVTK